MVRSPGRSERTEITVYLNNDLSCDYIEHRFRLIATEEGFNGLTISNEPPKEARLHSYDVMWGGSLRFVEGQDYIAVQVMWAPLRKGEYHEACVVSYPPGHARATFRSMTDRREHLIYRLCVPPDRISEVAVSAINAWPSHLEKGYRDFREFLTPTNNGLYAREWKGVAIGYSYGISWIPVEFLDS